MAAKKTSIMDYMVCHVTCPLESLNVFNCENEIPLLLNINLYQNRYLLVF